VGTAINIVSVETIMYSLMAGTASNVVSARFSLVETVTYILRVGTAIDIVSENFSL
jgi:hypothetical protein